MPRVLLTTRTLRWFAIIAVPVLTPASGLHVQLATPGDSELLTLPDELEREDHDDVREEAGPETSGTGHVRKPCAEPAVGAQKRDRPENRQKIVYKS